MNRDYPAKPARRGAPKKPRPSFRLFIAVELPAEVTQELVRWQQEYLARDQALRLVPEEQLHITLVFLGQMEERERDQAAAQLDEIAGLSAFEVAATEIVGLPRKRPPRVIAAAMEEPTGLLSGIHDRLAAGLVEKNLYKQEKRPYFPHVTIARAKGRTRLDLEGIHPEPVKFTAVRVTLYNSILKREGALHQGLKSVQLI